MPVTSPGLGVPSPARGMDQGDAAAQVRFRRALTLLVMTLFLPGSAQLVAGRKAIGRLALRVCLALAGTVVLVVLVGEDGGFGEELSQSGVGL